MSGQIATVILVVSIIAVCSVIKHPEGFSELPEYLMKPSIHSDTNNYIPFGKRIRLVCEINIQAGIIVDITWKAPPNLRVVSKNDKRINIGHLKVTPVKEAEHREIASQELIVEQATMADNGTYRCEVRDINNSRKYQASIFKLHVRESGEDYVMLPKDTMVYMRSFGRPTAIEIEYTSYPANITYYLVNDTGLEIMTGHHGKYELSHTNTYVKLRIKNPTVYDTGNYTLFVKAGKAENSLRLRVHFFAKPIAHMESRYVKPNEKVSFKCRSIGYPRPDISFAFVPCSSRPYTNCSLPPSARVEWDFSSSDNVSMPSESLNLGTDETPIANARTHNMISTQPGVVYCKATNIEGSEVTQADLLVSDLPDAITLVKERPKESITVGDHVTLVCSALVYNYTNDITFVHNNKELQKSDRVSHNYSAQLYAWQARLDIDHVTKDHGGSINCRVKTMKNAVESRAFHLEVLDPVAPMIKSGKNNEILSVDLQDPLKLECDVIGTPDPKIVWLKDGKPVQLEKNNNRMQLTKTTLIFEYLNMDDLGIFKCRAENKMGTVEKYWKVDVRTPIPPQASMHLGKSLIYINLSLLVVLIVGITLMSLYYFKKKKEAKTMKEAGLINFEEGNLDHYNPDLALDEQADLLPYNSEYEFPKERLKFGEPLGSGAFGVVMKATATRIMVHEEKTTVAVKMVKKATDNEAMRALVSELKILVHLGQHLNVVNLLGAVTKNIAKRELMVIVEYCRFGNVQSFLVNHRPYFIDQIVQETGEIDWSIVKNQSKCGSRDNGGSTQYIDPNKHLNSKRYVHHPGLQKMGMIDSCNTEVTTRTYFEVEDMDTANSNEPLWRTNYDMDHKGQARFINTTDLVCWAFQIASGMEYLASRKVLHGDLAARNILLCDDNVVKICDFGLARSMYKSNNYKKNGETPLPFKWLALECISDNVFSTYSDVWAYGIVLWELFSLGKVPYPGMEANQELYKKLRDGYRMDKPQYSNQEIYDIMMNCWYVKPDTRPSFKDLKSRFNAMLPAEMRDHYLELNEPYLRMNAERLARGDTVYLANLGPPEEPAPAAPNYVNGLILHLSPKIHNDKDCLKMSRADSESEESNFYFASFNSDRHSPTIGYNRSSCPPNGSKWHNTRDLPEEIPMLQSVANIFNSDSETKAITPKPREAQTKAEVY